MLNNKKTEGLYLEVRFRDSEGYPHAVYSKCRNEKDAFDRLPSLLAALAELKLNYSKFNKEEIEGSYLTVSIIDKEGGDYATYGRYFNEQDAFDLLGFAIVKVHETRETCIKSKKEKKEKV